MYKSSRVNPSCSGRNIKRGWTFIIYFLSVTSTWWKELWFLNSHQIMKHVLERQTWEAGPTAFSTSMENLPNGNESHGPWPCPSLAVKSWNATDHRLQGRLYLPATILGCPSDADQSPVLWQILTGGSAQVSANCITYSYYLLGSSIYTLSEAKTWHTREHHLCQMGRHIQTLVCKESCPHRPHSHPRAPCPSPHHPGLPVRLLSTGTSGSQNT